jgi:hypothetical protein
MNLIPETTEIKNAYCADNSDGPLCRRGIADRTKADARYLADDVGVP